MFRTTKQVQTRGPAPAAPVFYPLQRQQSHKQAESMNYPVITGASQAEIQEFNKENSVYTQGFRASLVQGLNTFKPVLAASGTFFYGVALSVSAFTSLADTQITFAINGRNVLVDTSALLLIPNYAQGMLYFPLPVPLTGKDTFLFQYLKNDAGNVIAYHNFVYKPAL